MTEVKSKKHRSDRELTKDDFTADDDDDAADALAHHAQPFVRASAEVLATRRIVRAVRTKETTSNSSNQSSNPFAQVSLVPPPVVVAPHSNTEGIVETNVVGDAVEEAKKHPAVSESSAVDVPQGSEDAGNEPKETTETTTSETTANEDAASKPFVFGSAAPFSGFGAVLPGNGFASSSTSSSSGFGAASSTGFGTGFSSFRTLGQNDTAATHSFSFATKKTRTDVDETTTTPVPPVAVLPEHYELKSGEEDEDCVLELRCRTWRLSTASTVTATNDHQSSQSIPPSSSSIPPSTTTLNDDATDEASAETKKWSEVGIGPLRVLRARPGGSYRMVQRRESSKGGSATIVILNVRLVALTLQTTASEVHVQLVTVSARPETWLFKFKLASEAQRFKECLNGIAGGDAASAPVVGDEERAEPKKDEPTDQ